MLGGQLAYAFSANFGVIQPYLSAEAHHEFEDDARTVRSFYLNDPFFIEGDRSFPVELTTDEPDEDFFVISVGASFVFKGGNQFFVNYDTLVGLDDVGSQAVTVGVRFEL
ncbi:MAG: autotransporter domain-containing protein [Pseudomonadales bacterium]